MLFPSLHKALFWLIGVYLLLFWSCQREKDAFEKFISDSKQLDSRTVHKYEFYDDGKVKIDHATSYYYTAGLLVDSVFSKQFYQYSKTGKIIAITNLVDSTREIRLYNSLDSLISEFYINQFDDTTHLRTVDYENGNRTKIISRKLFVKIPEEESHAVEALRARNYDTLQSTTVFVYENGNHTKTLSLDRHGIVNEERHHFYEGKQLAKTIIYFFLGSTKYAGQTTMYDTKNSTLGDHTTTDMQGNIVEFQKTSFQDDTTMVAQFALQDNFNSLAYYKNGRWVGDVSVDVNTNEKTTLVFKYDEQGRLIEEIQYTEAIANRSEQ
jgi:hypothetical protein